MKYIQNDPDFESSYLGEVPKAEGASFTTLLAQHPLGLKRPSRWSQHGYNHYPLGSVGGTRLISNANMAAVAQAGKKPKANNPY